jgi:hypothetical protein
VTAVPPQAPGRPGDLRPAAALRRPPASGLAAVLLGIAASLGPQAAWAQTVPKPVLQPPAAGAAKPKALPGKTGQASARAAGTHPVAPAAKPTGAAAVRQDDQSYLFTKGPREPGGPPSYVTSGARSFNQPWYMTIYDTTGGW